MLCCKFYQIWVNGRGDSNKTCFSSFNFTDFIFRLIALKKLPLKLYLHIYILYELVFLFFVLSLKEKIKNILSQIYFSTPESRFLLTF